MAGFMDYINRDKMCVNSLQGLTSFDWDFKIEYTKSAVMYSPPDELVHIRAQGIDGIEPIPEVDIKEIQLRGFTLLQPGLANTKPNPITINCQDLEDQALLTWMWDWVNKMNSLNDLSSYRREDLFANITVYQLNSSRVPVFMYQYFNCLPQMPKYGTQMDFTKEIIGRMSITIQGETWLPTPLNI